MDEIRFGIVRHRADFDPDWPREPYYPEVVPMQDVPNRTGKGAPIRIYDYWWRFIRAINDDAGYKYTRSVNMMWINTYYNPDDPNDIPKAESITNSHNFVAIDRFSDTGSHGRLLAFPHDVNPFHTISPVTHNWMEKPFRFFKAIASNISGGHINVARDVDAYFPLLKTAGERWLPMSRIELFRPLPFPATVTVAALNVRRLPNTKSEIVGRYVAGDTVAVVAYRLRGASVWGLTVKGWICLLIPVPRTFTTDWKLNTISVKTD